MLLAYSDCKASVDNMRTVINQQLAKLIPQGLLPAQELFEAARYSLMAPGKRLRPILAIATAEMLTGRSLPREILQPACALEMIQTFALIHDDLPAMDDDDFRRGIPSCHKAFSEATAILAGDYLSVLAFEIVADSPYITSGTALALTRTLAAASGGHGMIGGQILDMAAEGKSLNLSDLQLIHHKKTAALIAASFEFGGIVAHASQEQVASLKEIGIRFGMAFQIIDDILDVTEDSSTLGKPANSDIKNAKSTYVSLLGVAQARLMAEEEIAKAFLALDQMSGNQDLLRYLGNSILRRRA